MTKKEKFYALQVVDLSMLAGCYVILSVSATRKWNSYCLKAGEGALLGPNTKLSCAFFFLKLI